jgi:hypothetical protein
MDNALEDDRNPIAAFGLGVFRLRLEEALDFGLEPEPPRRVAFISLSSGAPSVVVSAALIVGTAREVWAGAFSHRTSATRSPAVR